MERGCREPEQGGNGAEKSENLVEESRSLVEISGNLTEESKNTAKENRSPAKESGNPAKESGKLMEESRSPVVPDNTRECLADPAAAVRGSGSLSGCSSPTFMAALSLTAPIPLEAAAVPVDLSQPTPSPPRLLSEHRREAVGQNWSPPAAGTGAEPLSILGRASSLRGSVGPLSRPGANRVTRIITVWDKAWHGIPAPAQTSLRVVVRVPCAPG